MKFIKILEILQMQLIGMPLDMFTQLKIKDNVDLAGLSLPLQH